MVIVGFPEIGKTGGAELAILLKQTENVRKKGDLTKEQVKPTTTMTKKLAVWP